jgi:hypothetical protein
MLFTLVTNLRQVIAQLHRQQFLVDLNVSSALIQQQTVDSLNFSSLSELFKKIVDYLLNSSMTNFKVRTHLYATVLNYLMVFDEDVSVYNNSSDKHGGQSSSSGRGIGSGSRAASMHENFRVLSSNMTSLLKQICSDSCEGLNITTMMGLSLLNKIIDMDINSAKWIKYINDNGYVACIVNSVASTDNQLLEECFHSQMKNEKVIYIFETKCALFLAMSKSVLGSELLVKNGLISTLASCSVFNLRIKFDRNLYANRNSNYLVPLLHQFYQIFFPVLNILISIVNTMGSNNIEIKSQVIFFSNKINNWFLIKFYCG